LTTSCSASRHSVSLQYTTPSVVGWPHATTAVGRPRAEDFEICDCGFTPDGAASLLTRSSQAGDPRTRTPFGAAPSAIYHCAGAGAASRYELACAIVDELGLAGPVTPITTADGPTVAARPRCTVLGTARAEALGLGLPSWRPGLARAVAALARRG